MQKQKSGSVDPDRKRNTSGFTLIELLIVLSIIAILTGLLLPALNGARGKARTLFCLNHMKQAGFGAFFYLTDYHWLPPARWANVVCPYDISKEYELVGNTVNFRGAMQLYYPERDSAGNPMHFGQIMTKTTFQPRSKFACPEAADGLYTDRYTLGVNTGSSPGLQKAKFPFPSRLAYLGETGGSFAFTKDANVPSAFYAFRHRQAFNVVYADGHANTRKSRTVNLQTSNLQKESLFWTVGPKDVFGNDLTARPD